MQYAARPQLPLQVVDVFLSVQRGHTAEARRGHCLSIDVVGDIARGEDPGGRGCGGIAIKPADDLDVTIFHLELAGENVRIGLVPNGNKNPGQVDFSR